MQDSILQALGEKAMKVTKQVKVGNILIGGGAPIAIQSMLNISAHDIENSVKQAKALDKESILYRHHIAYVNENNKYKSYEDNIPYEETEINQMVVDFMASMTDDYFISLYDNMFPGGGYKVKFKGYFQI